MKTVLLIVLISIGLGACSKKDDKLDFEVIGIKDVTLDTRSVELYLSARTKSGEKEKVEFSISDLPYGVFSYLSSSPTEILRLTAIYVAKKGVYPVTLTAKNERGLTKKFNFNLTVTQSKSEMLVGTWKHTAYGYDQNNDGILQEDEIDPDHIIPHQLVFLSDTTGYKKYENGTSAQFIAGFAANPGMRLHYDSKIDFFPR